ncbi:MAG: hypothetical protein V2A62_01875 [Candidatus Woesearchaeota archaeon]
MSHQFKDYILRETFHAHQVENSSAGYIHYVHQVASKEDLHGLLPTKKSSDNYTNIVIIQKTARIVLGEVEMQLLDLERQLEPKEHHPRALGRPFVGIRTLGDTPDLSGLVGFFEGKERYTALAIIYPPLEEMANNGKVLPDAIGKRFDQIYRILIA